MHDHHDHNHSPPAVAPLGCALLVPVFAPAALTCAHTVIHLLCWLLGAPCP